MARKSPKAIHPSAIRATESSQEQIGLERLVFFSDAVFAIAITLLALEIRLPLAKEELTNRELTQALLAIWPQYLAYGISFLVLGMFWISHHRKFRFIQRYDGKLLLINLFLLMTIAFIPFPTSVISEYGNQVATIFYASTITLTGLLVAGLWWYASYRHWLIDPQMNEQQCRRELRGPLFISAVFLLSIGLSFINNDLAKFSWLLIAPLLSLM